MQTNDGEGMIRFRLRAVNRSYFVVACLLAAVLVVGAWVNSLDNAFHFDDSHVVVSNIYIRSLTNVARFFTDANTFSSLPQNATYRPLVTLSLAIDYALGNGLEPRVFHLTQIVLLLVTGALLVLFFYDLTKARWVALFAATLFCVHTANTETMNLISARSELLSTVGLLASFLLFVRVPFARRTYLYLVPLAIGALAKAPLVVFAPLLFVYLMLYEKKRAREAFRETLPSLVLGVALLIFLNAMNSPQWTSGGGSRFHYFITQPFVWLHYFKLFFLPLGLTADTDWKPFADWYDTRAVAGYAFVALLVWWIVRAWRGQGQQPIAFGLTWFAIALVPTSSFFPLAEVANEHRIFFAWIGLTIAVTLWFVSVTVAVPRKLIVGFAVVVLLAHAIGAHERNEVWRTEESLWADVVRKSPGNGRAWMNYGLTQMAKGEYAEAKRSFDRSAAMLPNYSFVQINLGIVEGAVGNHEKAEAHFGRALELNSDANANLYYGRWLVGRGRTPEALPLLREAFRLSPALPEARGLLLRVLAAQGATEGLQPLIEETAQVDPNDPSLALVRQTWPDYQSALNAGLAAMQKQDWLGAAHATRDALRHNPRSADAHNNLGWSLAQLGFRTEAAAAYAQALAIDPSHERARNNLRSMDPSATAAHR